MFIEECAKKNHFYISTMESEIERFDIISFDFFDSLVLRDVLFPVDILKLVSAEVCKRYGIVDFENGECNLVASGSIQTAKEKSDADRLCEILGDLTQIIEKYSPQMASVEKLFYCKNQKTVISVAQGRGVILAALAKAGIEIFEYTPMQIELERI